MCSVQTLAQLESAHLLDGAIPGFADRARGLGLLAFGRALVAPLAVLAFERALVAPFTRRSSDVLARYPRGGA